MIFWLFAFFFVSAAVFYRAFLYEPRNFDLDYLQVNLPRRLSRKYRILHLTDIHFSEPRKALSKFFDRLGQETWDFIFLTGDIFDCNGGAETGKRELKKLKSNFGTFAVFGNHDHYDYGLGDIFHGMRYHPDKKNDMALLQSALAQAGVQVLRNQSTLPKLEKDSILIHGLDDPVTGQADFEAIKRALHPEKTNILLTHTIDAFLYLPENAVQVSFSGHSHGGQIRIPGWGAFITHTRFGKRYAQGMNLLKDAVCIVSRGLGTSRFFEFRLFCKPQAIVAEVS